MCSLIYEYDGQHNTKRNPSSIINRPSLTHNGQTSSAISKNYQCVYLSLLGGGPRVLVSTAAFHARVRGSVPGLGGLKETKNVSSPSTCES